MKTALETSTNHSLVIRDLPSNFFEEDGTTVRVVGVRPPSVIGYAKKEFIIFVR